MKKLWLFSAFLVISSLTGCGGGGNTYVSPVTPYEKIKTAFAGVENSFKNISSIRRNQARKNPLAFEPSSTLNSLFALYTSEDNQGDVIEDLSYTQPPMIQFQCLKYAFDKIGSGYSFDTKYYDNVTGEVYIDLETGAEAEHTSTNEFSYDFLLALDINIDDNDLITADVSFNITISKGNDNYHTNWYVSMALDYDMDNVNPTYTLTMLTNNDERGLPYYNRCVYEYDYVDVKENKINEWRKFDLETPNPIVKDASHQTLDAYINEGMTYKVGVFAWYKNNSLYKAKNIQREDNRRQQVANLFFDLGLNASDIDSVPFFNKQGTKNSVIQTMYQEFSNIFRKDIIYSLVTDDDAYEKEKQKPRYLKLVNYRGDGDMNEDNECYLGDGNATFADLFNGQNAYMGESPFVPRLMVLNKNNEYVRDVTNDDIAIKVVVKEDNLVPVAMTDRVINVANQYHLPVMKLEVSLVYNGEVLDSKRVTIDCSVYSDSIKGWPYDILASLHLDELVPPFTSKSMQANVEGVNKIEDPLGCEIYLSAIEENDINQYQNKLKEMGYGEIYKNPVYAIPDTERGIVFGIWFDGYTLKIQQKNEFQCVYSEGDKGIFSILNQDVLLPEGLVFQHPNNIAEFFDYYGVSSDVFNSFIKRLTDNDWKENDQTVDYDYKYYIDYENQRYCVNYENIGNNAVRIIYLVKEIPSQSFYYAEVVFKKDGSMTMGKGEDGNCFLDYYFSAEQEFYIRGYDMYGSIAAELYYSNLEINSFARTYLTEGKEQYIKVTQSVILRVKIVTSGSVHTIICSIPSNGEQEIQQEEFKNEVGMLEQHTYTEATLVWDYYYEVSGLIEMYEGTSVIEYVDGKWQYKSGAQYKNYISSDLLGRNATYYANMAPRENHIMKYFIEPLKVTMMPDPNIPDLNDQRNLTVTFDYYGFVTSYDFEMINKGSGINYITRYTVSYK